MTDMMTDTMTETMNGTSATHVVLIPSYNPGPKVFETVTTARAQWAPVWVVVDGSTDGSAEALAAMARSDPGLQVLTLPRNCGKGAAVAHGARAARPAGFTHVLTMESDGQHPATPQHRRPVTEAEAAPVKRDRDDLERHEPPGH